MKHAVFALLVVGALLFPSQPTAQGVYCADIRRGETAATVAARLTGNARNRNAPWFQILNPTASRYIPKAQYDHIRPGWRACVLTALPAAASPADISMTLRVLDTLARASTALDVSAVLPIALVILILLVWSGGPANAAGKRMLEAMQRFGERFIAEFERPLLEPGEPERPIESRLRVSARRRQVEVLLAPKKGRRYPNLTDHRKNVEYDVERVLMRLGHPPFVCSSLSAKDPWVVVQFTLQVGSEQAGAS